MKMGDIIRIIGIAIREPYKVRTTASWPRPSLSNWCPGRIESIVSSSGAPRKIAGMKSINVWVIDMATIKTTRARGAIVEEVKENKSKEATRFMWMPGERPVNVPEITPSSNAMVISRIILSLPKV